MSTVQVEFTVQKHFEGKEPVVHKIYDRLLKALKQIGPIIEEPKKTSISIAFRFVRRPVTTTDSGGKVNDHPGDISKG